MQTSVSFLKATILAQQGMRNHLKQKEQEEKECKEAIYFLTRSAETWIEEVIVKDLVLLQYLYIVCRERGREIFSIEQYDNLFYTEEFKEKIYNNSNAAFRKLILDFTQVNIDNYFLELELEKITEQVVA